MTDKCYHGSLKITGQEQLGCVTCALCGKVLLAEDMASYFLSQLGICMASIRSFQSKAGDIYETNEVHP